MIGNRQGKAAFGATASENFTTVLCGHSQAEAVLIDSSAVGGLKSPFHLILFVNFFRCNPDARTPGSAGNRHSGAKLINKLETPKFS